ncbi:MAG: PAS domain S-box protein [Bacteroidetes bacterium]|nr:PAS domain S-box protein [Bacteroidota bacterium]
MTQRLSKKIRDRDVLFLIITLAITFLIFQVDNAMGNSISLAPLYSLVILFSWLIPFSFALIVSVVCIVLLICSTIIGIKTGSSNEQIMFNSFIGFSTIAVTYILTQITTNSAIELSKNNRALSRLVDQKTRELQGKIKDLTDYQVLLKENKEILHELHNVLAKSEHRYQMMINQIRDYSFVFVNKNGEISTWNSGASHLRGFMKEEVLGKKFYEFILAPTDNLQKEGQKIMLEIEKNNFYENYGYRIKPNGSSWYSLEIISKINDENGDYMGLSWVTHDLSELKFREEQIGRLNQDLEIKVEKRTKELESFVYTVSHDLRAPLRAIKGFAEIIEEEFTEKLNSEDFTRFVGFIQSNSKKMSTLIDDLLLFSRIGKKSIENNKINTEVLFKNIESEMRLSHPEYNHVKINYITKLPEIRADQTLITQAFTNLISNALKYSSKKENPELKISCLRSDSKFVFTFKDNGAGFDDKYKDKLFKIFQRLHDGYEFEGTGIGLAIVKQVADIHNGSVHAKGVLNEGATFKFKLPIQK